MLRPPILLACIVAIGGALRTYHFGDLSLWLDEGITLHVVRLPWSTVLGFHGAYETHPPLYFILVKLFTLIVPEVHAGRVVSLVAGTATIPVLYALAVRLLGVWPALVASAALAVSPVHIWYSREGRMYALGVLFVTASYLAVVAFYRSPRRSTAVLYGVAVLAAMYTNYGAIFTLIPQLIPLMMVSRRHGRAGFAIWVAGAAAAVAYLPWLPVLLGTTNQLGSLRDNYLGVNVDKVVASVVSIAGVGGGGSYFWGSQTPWERWSWMPIVVWPAIALIAIASVVVMVRRPLSLATALGFLPGTLAVAAILSVVSPGYADRTVLAGVVGWSLLLGALACDQQKLWLKVPAWIGMIAVMGTSLITLRAIYSGDKQHWSDLAANAATAATLGAPVWAYPMYTGTLIDAYQPAVFGLTSARPAAGTNRIIADHHPAPESDATAIWLAYVEAIGIELVQRQLSERGYERLIHRYHWNPLYLDLYIKERVRPGQKLAIDANFGAPASGERLYILDLEAQQTSTTPRPRVFLACSSERGRLEIGPDESGVVVRSADRWQPVSIAVLCPRDTTRVALEVRDGSIADLTFREFSLWEISRLEK